MIYGLPTFPGKTLGITKWTFVVGESGCSVRWRSLAGPARSWQCYRTHRGHTHTACIATPLPPAHWTRRSLRTSFRQTSVNHYLRRQIN